MTRKNPKNVDLWIKNRNSHQVEALENASRIFDDNDPLTVNTLEAIYGQESSFGNSAILKKDKRGEAGAAGHFQIQLATAKQHSKIKITENNDIRFDIDDSSEIAALHLVYLNKLFSRPTILTSTVSTISIKNINERKPFIIAAYNAGQTIIARAQMEAQADSKDPKQWEIVQKYLKKAGAIDDKIKEITEYVEKVLSYEKEFSEKSKANKKLKDLKPKKVSQNNSEDGYWITLDDGRRILVKNRA